MSRIGKKSIDIPGGVKVELKGLSVKVSGPLGQLQMEHHPRIKVKVDSSGEKVLVENDRPQDRFFPPGRRSDDLI